MTLRRNPVILAAILSDLTIPALTIVDKPHAARVHDLTGGRDLTGIRWSDWGTTWPPGTDTGALRASTGSRRRQRHLRDHRLRPR